MLVAHDDLLMPVSNTVRNDLLLINNASSFSNQGDARVSTKLTPEKVFAISCIQALREAIRDVLPTYSERYRPMDAVWRHPSGFRNAPRLDGYGISRS
jgi:hypothetical protein